MTPERQTLGKVCLGGSVLCSLGTWYSAATVASQPNPAIVVMVICAGIYLLFGLGAVAILGYQRGKRPYFVLGISRMIFAGGVLFTVMQIAFRP